jgi:S-adenosylmethionine synthetase
MKNISLITAPEIAALDSECVERKGLGHPDTIADALAERLSVAYSRYTLDRFGAILHHNFDKISVLGGATKVDFGDGAIIKPIRVILNGRASIRFAGEVIPVRTILEEETRDFFSGFFGDLLKPQLDLRIHWFVSSASGPGRTEHSKGSRAHLFEPGSISEVKGYDRLLNNDTSMGCGYAPLSPIENAVLSLEQELNSPEIKERYPWLGTDIKLMAVRSSQHSHVTVCLPQIARYVESTEAYRNNIEDIRSLMEAALDRLLFATRTTLSINTRDDHSQGDIYLTVTGSSIESGDEGIVGRGNRINGLITPFRPMNLEGVCGKNPKYYTGKLYNIAAARIAERLFRVTNVSNEVLLVSEAGRPLIEPKRVIVRLSKPFDEELVTTIIEDEILAIPTITNALLKEKVRLY